MGAAVLPGGEPEGHPADLVLAAFLEEGIDDGEIVLALDGLDLLPIDGHFNGVGVHGFDGGPHAGHHARPGAGVVGLAAEHEEGRAIDEEGVAAVLGDDFGHVGGGGGLAADGGDGGQEGGTGEDLGPRGLVEHE